MAKTLTEQLAGEGWLKSGTRVGLEYWSYVPPRAVSEIYEHAFVDAGAKVSDGSDVLRTIRTIKSPAEITVMEHAARIVGFGPIRPLPATSSPA